MVLAAITFFYVLIAFDGGQKLFRDADAGWHIRTGESILDTGQLPRTDPYSLTKRGEPWFAWEWGADVAMGWAHQHGGLASVALLYTFAIAACTWLWVRLHWTLGGTFLLSAILVIPMLSTANLHWLARPHIFGWLFVLAAWNCLPAALSRRAWIGWAAFGALWANVHASFPLWIAILALLAAAERSRHYAAVAIAFAFGTLANPYGWELHRHIAAYLSNRELLERIGEFQSFNFHVDGAGQILAVVLIAMAGAITAIGQGRLGPGLVGLMLVAAALRSARMLPLLALIGLPLANAALTRWWRSENYSPGALLYSENLRRLELGARGWIWAPVVLLLGFALLRTPAFAARTGFPPDQFPVEAAAQLPAGARLFAPDKFGGYLIYCFAGARPVFFDGRSDFYGVQFMKDYIRLVEARPGWPALFDRHRFTHALLPTNYSLIPALEARGWKMTYSDRTAVLLARPKD